MRQNIFFYPSSSNRNVRSSESPLERFPSHHLAKRKKRKDSKKPLRIMKFGGTSVGDATCIQQTIAIIREFSLENELVVVVSAMSGVTNKLIEAATKAESGDLPAAAQMLESMRVQHSAAADSLIHLISCRENFKSKFQQILAEGQHLCQDTMLLHELNSRVRDSISGLGERLSAPLVAAALADSAVPTAPH